MKKAILAFIMLAATMVATAADAQTEKCVSISGANGSSAQVCIPGTQPSTGVNKFLGVQYATADVWKQSTFVDYSVHPPVNPAISFGPKCAQAFTSGIVGDSAKTCLNLNIYAPADPPDGPLPVMLFIHGGAFIFGSNQDNLPNGKAGTTMYDGSWLAANRNVVVVAINYRLGALGFLPIALDDANAPSQHPSNFGLWDQQKAIQWVQTNIAGFGGDPNNIVMFGESAGAMSVGIHLVNPSRGSAIAGVKAAIMESNPLGVTYRDLKKDPIFRLRQDETKHFVECLTETVKETCNGTGLGTTIPDDLLDAKTIAATQIAYLKKDEKGAIAGLGVPGLLPFTPVIDGDQGLPIAGQIMPAQPTAVLRDAGSPLPLLFGYNANEGVLFAEMADIRFKGEVFGVQVDGPMMNSLTYPPFLGVAVNPKVSAYVLSHVDGRYGLGTPLIYGFDDPNYPTPVIKEDAKKPHARIMTAMASALTDFGFACGNLGIRQGSAKAPV